MIDSHPQSALLPQLRIGQSFGTKCGLCNLLHPACLHVRTPWPALGRGGGLCRTRAVVGGAEPEAQEAAPCLTVPPERVDFYSPDGTTMDDGYPSRELVKTFDTEFGRVGLQTCFDPNSRGGWISRARAPAPNS